ncbi:MAG: signal peptidase I [Caulobacteraceae bacterium]|nr:signal peptidase I [Caulobacteraceae bacterium]
MKSRAGRRRSATLRSETNESWETIKTIVYALIVALVVRTLLFQPFTIPSASEEPNLYKGDYIIVTKWSYGYSRHSILFSPPLFTGRVFFHPPRRGDIIVFKLPRDGHTDYIKRLIGLPGDRIQERRGQLYINGAALPEQPVRNILTHDRTGPDGEPVTEHATIERETNPEGRRYLVQTHGGGEPADNTGVYVVPPHCYFMMGDNRDNSADSRFDPGVAPEDPHLGGCGWNSRLDPNLGYAIGVGFVPEDNLVGRARLVLVSWSDKVSLFKPWTWITDLRPSRFFTWLQ